MHKQSKLALAFGKGGAAKSLVSAGVSSVALQAGRKVEIFDFDPANPSLRRQFSLPPSHVLNKGDGDDYVYQALGQIADVAASDRNVVVDLGAGMDRPVLRFLKNEGFLDFCESVGILPTFLMPISSRDSLGNIRTALQAVPALPIICVVNRFFPAAQEAEQHEVFAEIRKTAIGVVELPNLGRVVVEAANRNLSLDRMASDESVTPWLRHGAKIALKKIEEVFAPYAERLP